MNWWLNNISQFWAPEQSFGAIPGTRQEESGTPAETPEKAEAARKQVEQKLQGLDKPPEGSSVPPAPQAADEDPFVKLTLSDGREQEVKRSYALEQAARAVEAEKAAAEAREQLKQLQPLVALKAWADQNPSERVPQLQALVEGKLPPASPPPSRSTPSEDIEDDSDILRPMNRPSETPPQADRQLLDRIEQLEKARQQDDLRQQARALEGYRQQLFDTCREKMKNFRIFSNDNWRTLGEDRIRNALANDAVLAQLDDPGVLVQQTAELYGEVAKKQAMKDARDIRRAKALSGGVAPTPTPARSQGRKIITDDRRVRDHGVKNSIVERLIQD